ncbi:ATP-dependent protease ClpP protease subunit [Rhodococcus percolatus]|uniref:head maturation protease, ClpP-related n=1 Tax=Rhodococcus opacus TaxID=37919 RepID=UPI001AE84607|nr:head maturation protease, ClpP-related [Rhodococcus opacus]MBP2208172.1 ATP-dependent protease ClpP protease subunit [Rhodococcus opacus]
MTIRNGAGGPSRSREWCRINAQAGAATEIMIYDVIGSYWMETDAQSIANQIKDLDTDEIVVRLNSPGGDAFDGIAIMNALRAHSATVTVRIDGLAASAASVIAMAGDEIVMGEGSQMMIHEAWLYTSGSADYLRSEADRLDKMTDSITSLYARRAGGEFDEWRALVAAETWFTAEEAVAAGLADKVGTSAPDSGAPTAAFNLSHFRFAGRDHAPAPRIPSAEAVEVTNRKEGDMPTLKEVLAQRLGTAADATDEIVVAALDEVLAEQAEDRSGPGIEARAGVVTVDADQFAAMQAEVAAGREFRTRQEAAESRSYIDTAIKAGKFPPAKAEHYEKLLAAAPAETRALIDAMPANVIPVAEVGHDGDAVKNDDHTTALTAVADRVGLGAGDHF